MYPKQTLLAALLILGAVTLAVHSWVSHGDGAMRSDATVPSPRATSPLIVHEWGTFTSFSGSDSVKLEFRPLADSDLPPFVLNRGSQSGELMLRVLTKPSYKALQRMETLVTYFYTDRSQAVNVRVGFPQGLLTEFYPPVEKMQPAFKHFEPEPVADSLLDWGKVWIIPENQLQVHIDQPEIAQQVHAQILQKLLPSSYDKPHYAYARETDSALLYVERLADKSKHMSFPPRGAFFEKFLFYRGIGNFDLPLKLTAHSDGRFELLNVGSEPIRSLFLVTVAGEGLRFVKYDEIRSGEQLMLKQSETTSTPDQLGEAVVKALTEERLYEKEARAMVKTWQASWFGEQGTRLFYVLPQTITNQLLPLHVEPQPEEVVRVMVGRLEIMTPEDEARITKFVKQSADARAEAAKNSQQAAYALPDQIVQLGRLAEPALIRVKNISKDDVVRVEADQLLRQLQQRRS